MAKVPKVFYAQRLPQAVIDRIGQIADKMQVSEAGALAYLIDRYDLSTPPPVAPDPPMTQILKPSATTL